MIDAPMDDPTNVTSWTLNTLFRIAYANEREENKVTLWLGPPYRYMPMHHVLGVASNSMLLDAGWNLPKSTQSDL